MKLDFSQPGKITFKISKAEKENLEQLKATFIRDLEEYALEEREELDGQLSQFYRPKDKISKLHVIRLDIIQNLLYEEHFKGLVVYNGTQIMFPSNEEFYHFANGYNVLDDPTRGYALLKNHVGVQVIDRLIKVWYSKETEKEFEFHVEEESPNKLKHNSHPFSEDGLKFFEHCLKEAKKTNRRLLSTIYHFFKSKGLLQGNQLQFAHFYNRHYGNPKIRIYPNKAGLDPMDWKHSTTQFLEAEMKNFFNS